ncbi:MAG: sulfate ABC transporter ATP-binding protein [Oceanospirillaceae bacterium]|uniref:sulfate/molybdate ABC transporter ATP-binding protein n=1 Tax=unclassified Thalassolituus TaxID=2624967 RepID=UPI000C670822|nr:MULTISPECIES: TOBE-like domain-containing protein [unclassified Thalassolituus]MAX98841.1 sulfate ABC transporter ATP-binding protein [Oceanospirillaceae bacterium]MBL33662.1 sulfate ABC transporter ATP-binding protein [Oceanospirillaceae bacterium]MBS53930.1 sulfate ABC transporter ATP-binding protein [Oceanospirillaceae bacterium]|tara:strand:+ start:5959 stop:7101 length:1143 start_codon:yes stop_codon:yes gene_type:complete
MSIRIENLSKRFGQFQALSPLSLNIEEGAMVGLLGPSGSGKTTLLRIIAGLESADSGQIQFAGRDVTNLHVRDRRVGFVFQNYALFRHMTVAQNIAFGLEVLPKKERPDNAEIQRRVSRLLERVQLPHLANRYPSQLSGGQKQRIALARALATHPEVLLLDEPFGALDAKVRKELRRWLRSLHEEIGFTSVFVTHDQEEALELSDQVVVMSNGNIEQVDTPAQLYAKPNSRFVFDFLGSANIFHGSVDSAVNASANDGTSKPKLTNGNAWIELPVQPNDALASAEGDLYIRSHRLTLSRDALAGAHLPFIVVAANPVGADVRVELRADGWDSDALWEVDLTHDQNTQLQFKKGDKVFAAPQTGYFFKVDQREPQKFRFID